jgi:cysteine desulfurase
MVYALKQALAQQPQRFENLQFLRNTLINKCREWQIVPTLPETAPVSPYILNLLLPEQQSAIVVRALSERGIFIASGSACSAESDTPSAAMLAIGRNRREAYRSLRLSFRGDETPEDADFFLFELENVLKNY